MKRVKITVYEWEKTKEKVERLERQMSGLAQYLKLGIYEYSAFVEKRE